MVLSKWQQFWGSVDFLIFIFVKNTVTWAEGKIVPVQHAMDTYTLVEV
jgi:hypothetical protein